MTTRIYLVFRFLTNEPIPEKQLRYEKYLVCVKNNRGDALRLLQPKLMTEWERDRERVEFERAAILYQPLNTAMSKRFVSAGLSQVKKWVFINIFFVELVLSFVLLYFPGS